MVDCARVGLAAVPLVALILTIAVRADDWPQWRGPNRDGAWSETGILETFPAGGLNIRWHVSVGIGFSSPVVADGRVYVTDSELAKPKARERVHAFDALTGKQVWSYAYDVDYAEIAFDERYLRGPIATPIVADGRIYTWGAVGNLFCLEALKGDVVWQKDLQKEYPTSDLYTSGSPLVEGNLLIVLVGAKPDACVIAFDKNTGQEVWKSLDEAASASSPIVVNAGGKRQLIIWTPQAVTALDPATGNTYWRERLNTTQDATVSTPVYHDGNLLIGGLMLKLDSDKPGATVLWPKSRATARRILSDTSTALFRDDYIYSARSAGEFVCLEASTGNQVWETDKVTDLKSGASIHLTANGNSVLLYNDRGDLIRAQLTPKGYQELSRARVLEPAVTFSGRKTAWAAPAFANRHIYARTNKELVCSSLAAEP
jgi:outer membrane protein assembly factor BamB